MLRAGRRWGKTVGCSGKSVESFLDHKRVLYAVPTQDQMTRFWHEVTLALAEPIEFGVFKKYESDHIIELPGTEQRIRAKTAWNANTLRGDYGDLIILDEFQLMAEDTLKDVVYPMLIDNNGDLVLVYTPPSLHSRLMSKAVDKRHAAKLFKQNQTDPRWLCIHSSSHDNPYISKEGLAEVTLDMTELSRKQEIEALDLDEVPGALWTLQLLDDLRLKEIPDEALPLARVVVGVDPTGSTTNEAGIVTAALGKNGHGYVITDATPTAASPRRWAQEAVWQYYDHKADRVVAEENFGGDMVKGTIETVDENVSYKGVNASRGKAVRAEPIAALYEKLMIHHVGDFTKLEEEMCSYVPILSKTSPNRMDALVWALTDLFPENQRLALVELAQEAMAAQKITKENIAKVAVNAQSDRCPQCNYHGIAIRGPIKRCSSCGHEWSTSIKMVQRSDRKVRQELFEK